MNTRKSSFLQYRVIVRPSSYQNGEPIARANQGRDEPILQEPINQDADKQAEPTDNQQQSTSNNSCLSLKHDGVLIVQAMSSWQISDFSMASDETVLMDEEEITLKSR